ncbi:hypothetical protein NDU88_011282 [Pleurodeles waltl]|uniref:Uncharacterized protein n=1 Tax=Pleurodeles waltl TaxID=8319 RepID=A0AAV7QYD2_PLEWA|nr:hypothetical protein NDU88_011282 [Pleurodeles waltl]
MERQHLGHHEAREQPFSLFNVHQEPYTAGTLAGPERYAVPWVWVGMELRVLPNPPCDGGKVATKICPGCLWMRAWSIDEERGLPARCCALMEGGDNCGIACTILLF